MSESIRAHVYVTGRVQGVFFRYSAASEASNRGLAGWIRNLDDGRVEGVFEGRRADVEALVEWCRHGPPHAEVHNVEVAWEETRGEEPFSVG